MCCLIVSLSHFINPKIGYPPLIHRLSTAYPPDKYTKNNATFAAKFEQTTMIEQIRKYNLWDNNVPELGFLRKDYTEKISCCATLCIDTM